MRRARRWFREYTLEWLTPSRWRTPPATDPTITLFSPQNYKIAARLWRLEETYGAASMAEANAERGEQYRKKDLAEDCTPRCHFSSSSRLILSLPWIFFFFFSSFYSLNTLIFFPVSNFFSWKRKVFIWFWQFQLRTFGGLFSKLLEKNNSQNGTFTFIQNLGQHQKMNAVIFFR